MGVSKGVIIGAVVGAVVAGFVIGILIGHFGINKPTESGSSSPQKQKSDPNANRKFLFEQASAPKIKENLRYLSSEPHLAGSSRNNDLGDWMVEKWRSYGLDTKEETYQVLLSYPGDENNRNRAQILSSAGAIEYVSQLVEKPLVPEMNDTEAVPPFNGYAKAADIMRDVVYYVNYCQAEDFDHIVTLAGVDLNDSIVICRYGKIFRGNKAQLAQQHGAAGVIIYNDPADSVDSSKQPTYEDTFPNSWYLPPSGAERGSVMIFSGDPQTPGFPSKEYAQRKSVDQIRQEEIIPNIPTQPLGYDDAKKFLEQLPGNEVQADWKGSITDLTYKYGGQLPDGRKFQVINNNRDAEMTNITNVFGIIRGSEEPDRYVIMGNHRDAWMFGATDASSGTSIMLETTRMFSELMKTGWRPRRSIVFCSWDGEEYGIIGSIEWLEDLSVILGARSVAYLNCDSGVVYNEVLKMGSSPLMFDLIYNTAKQVAHPEEKGKSLYDDWNEKTADTTATTPKPKISDLGSGSDHTGFYHRHGITSMDLVYYYDKSKTNVIAYYPLYHTTYDTFLSEATFVDPDFTYHRSLSQFFAEMIRSLSDSPVIPFKTADYAKRLQEVFVVLKSNVETKLAQKGLEGYLVHLKKKIDRFSEVAAAFDEEVKTLNAETSWSELRRRNDQLTLLERSFLYPLGILDRRYIKHVVFAPSATDSYSSAAFPGIGDALYKIGDDQESWSRVEEELTKAVYTIESATKTLILEDLI